MTERKWNCSGEQVSASVLAFCCVFAIWMTISIRNKSLFVKTIKCHVWCQLQKIYSLWANVKLTETVKGLIKSVKSKLNTKPTLHKSGKTNRKWYCVENGPNKLDSHGQGLRTKDMCNETNCYSND